MTSFNDTSSSGLRNEYSNNKTAPRLEVGDQDDHYKEICGILCKVLQPLDPSVHTHALLTVLGTHTVTSTLIVRTRQTAILAARLCKELQLSASGPITIDITEEISDSDHHSAGTTTSLVPLMECVRINVPTGRPAIAKRLRDWSFFNGSGVDAVSTMNNNLPVTGSGRIANSTKSTSTTTAAASRQQQGDSAMYSKSNHSGSRGAALLHMNVGVNVVTVDGCRIMKDGEIRTSNSSTPSASTSAQAWPSLHNIQGTYKACFVLRCLIICSSSAVSCTQVVGVLYMLNYEPAFHLILANLNLMLLLLLLRLVACCHFRLLLCVQQCRHNYSSAAPNKISAVDSRMPHEGGSVTR
jgi:hypothetical protein